MVTRRCTQRQFLLLPSKTINRIFQYCLAMAARDTGVSVHAACVLSNHYHIVVTDRRAELPRFVYILNKFVSKCVNAHRGRWENLFAGGSQASYVRLGDPDAVLEKTVYTITNPVKAGLVHQSALWPGVNLWRPGKYKVRRPEIFFRDAGPAPKSITLELAPIPLQGSITPRETMERLGRAVAEREKALRANSRQQQKRFLGVARVLAQSPTDTPSTRAPRQRLGPRVASRNKWRRVELLQRLKEFWLEYKAALVAWRAGDHQVVFPVGVYKMRIEFGVRCAER